MARPVVAGLVLLLPLLTSLSCGTDPHAAAQARLKRLRATDVFVATLDLRLAEAVAIGDKAAVDAAVKAGGNVNARGHQGMPLLMWALAKDSVAGFDALLEHRADLKALAHDPALTRKGERTPQIIERVIASPNSDFLRAALKRGFDPDYVPNPRMNESLLFRTVWNHNIPNAAVLLDAGANINHVEANRDTPLLLAQGIRDYEMVFFLLSRGADVHHKTHGDYDLVGLIKQYGTRGVMPKQHPHFLKVVEELKKRNLITDADIENANNNAPFSNRDPQNNDPGNP